MKQQESHLSIFKTQLDSISEDIKETQSLLRECGVPFPVRILCETRTEYVPAGDDALEIHYNECLAWDTIESGSKSDWVLLYEESEQVVGFVTNGSNCCPVDIEQPQNVITKKRLIETSVDVRLRMYKHLEELINKVCKELKLDEFQEIHSNLKNALQKLQPMETTTQR